MSATNHTSNYNLPIYESGNRANWLVDFNGAMNTIDRALNENKLAGDTLKTDVEELQTDFQQVSTKADAAEQAATQASTNAANALTIANNATTIAGDAQVDAHAVLEAYQKTASQQLTVTGSFNGLTNITDFQGHLNMYFTNMGCNIEADFYVTPSGMSKLTEAVSSYGTTNIYYNPKATLNLVNIEFWHTLIESFSNNYYFEFCYTNYDSPTTKPLLGIGVIIINNMARPAIRLRSTIESNASYGASNHTAVYWAVPIMRLPKLDTGLLNEWPLIVDLNKLNLEDLEKMKNL